MVVQRGEVSPAERTAFEQVVRAFGREPAEFLLMVFTAVGGPRRTVMEYARSLDPAKVIEPLSLNDVTFVAPVDTSLDTRRYRELLQDEGLKA